MAYAVGGDAGFTKALAMSMGWGLLFATSLTLIVLPCMLLVQRDFMAFFHRKILKTSTPNESQANDMNKITTSPKEAEESVIQ